MLEQQLGNIIYFRQVLIVHRLDYSVNNLCRYRVDYKNINYLFLWQLRTPSGVRLVLQIRSKTG